MLTANLIDHNIATLLEAGTLLDSISVDEYCLTDDSKNTSSIGKHIRHVLDHYSCFKNGLALQKINYDHRVRDPRIENDPDFAIENIFDICRSLVDLKEKFSEKPNISSDPLIVCCSSSPHQPECIETISTIGRELSFLQSHAVHHFALIKLLLQDSKLSVDENFGIAATTVNYIHSNAA